MAREDWISIGVKKDTVKKIDDFLKSKEAKQMEINNRQQALAIILSEFFEKGSIINQKKLAGNL